MHGRICHDCRRWFHRPWIRNLSDDWTGVDAYKLTNPLEAAGGAPAWLSSKSSRSWVTSNSSVSNYIMKGADYMVGDSQA
jgi:hypothetical protein